MKKKLFYFVSLLFVTVLSFTLMACSNEDTSYEEKVTEENPLADTIVQAMEKCANSASEQYVISSTDGINIVDKSTFVLSQMIELGTSSNEETTFTYNAQTGTVKSNIKISDLTIQNRWYYAGRASSNGFSAIKFATNLANQLPKDKTITLKIVPVLNENKEVIAYDVYYQIS